jgi:hypothetical protein
MLFDPQIVLELVGPPAFCLVLLIWLNRVVMTLVMRLVYSLSRNMHLAVLAYALLVLPGTAVHELSHWLVARLLGVPAGMPVLVPQHIPQQLGNGSRITLGYVMIARVDFLRSSLIGVAPFVAGCALVALLAQWVFATEALTLLLNAGGVQASVRALVASLWDFVQVRQGGWVYLYLIFAVANGMLPSPSDREDWPWVLIFLALLLGGIYFAIGVPAVPTDMTTAAVTIIQWLTFALLVTVVIDVACLIVLLPVERLFALVRR